MSYKNILVYLNDAQKARKIVHHATEVARAFEARLVGLHVSSPRRGGAGTHPRVEGLTFSRNEDADHLRAIFEEVTNQGRGSGGGFRRMSSGPAACRAGG